MPDLQKSETRRVGGGGNSPKRALQAPNGRSADSGSSSCRAQPTPASNSPVLRAHIVALAVEGGHWHPRGTKTPHIQQAVSQRQAIRRLTGTACPRRRPGGRGWVSQADSCKNTAYSSPVLRAHIAALAVEGGGVVPGPKHVQQLLVRHLQLLKVSLHA